MSMRELLNDSFYKMLENYEDCVIDYFLIEDDTAHQGYRSHKDAVLFAIIKVIERYIDNQLKAEIRYCKEVQDEPFPWKLDIGKAKAYQVDSEMLFYTPETLSANRVGQRVYDDKMPNTLKKDQIQYWYLFCETPHTSGYGLDDFHKINSVLFSKGTDNLEVYEWTTDWSNYFDAGNEWWGTACWSIYDRNMNRYVVIMASTTD